MANEKLQIDLLFLDDIISFHVNEVSPEYSLLAPARSENPHEVRDASAASGNGIYGPPNCIQTDEGSEWKNEIWTRLRSCSRE